MSNMTVNEKREMQVADAMQLESINNQLVGLLENNPKRMEVFKSRMLKMSTTYMLKDCSPESLIAVGLQALTLDLPLEAGQGYVVKYGKDAQLDIGYKGWQMLAKRSGSSVMADAVYKCDLFQQSGFGFDAELKFEPAHGERRAADDKWVHENIVGVIVSIKDDATGAVTYQFVPADMLHKIVGNSPSVKSDKAKQFSPHENWKQQMFIAKAIKQVLSKMPVDLSVDSSMSAAIQMVNETEATSQAIPESMPRYPQERFDENWPKWVELVKAGKQKGVGIANQLSNGYSLSESQLEKAMSLKDFEPIEGEVEEAEIVEESEAS